MSLVREEKNEPDRHTSYQMKPNSLLLVLGIICCLLVGCQKKKKSEDQTQTPETPPVASLVQQNYALGDTLVITLSQPLERVSVWLNQDSVAIRQPNRTTIRVPVGARRVGVQQVVVRGLGANQVPVSDTLAVEVRSDHPPRQLAYKVLMTYPHRTESFTQGLEFHQGSLYESTGLNGHSRLMRVELTTGAVLQSVDLSDQYFGEGITLVGDRIYQLTWTSGECFRYTLGFKPDGSFRYPTQGWGLTHKDTTLILSDGTNRLYFYTPEFRRVGDLAVYDDKGAVMKLNELEYVNGYVLANVWETNRIVQIDLASGKVVGELNLSALVPSNLRDPGASVLNGIAYLPGEKALYVTGKNWPVLFKLKVNDLLKSNEQGGLAL